MRKVTTDALNVLKVISLPLMKKEDAFLVVALEVNALYAIQMDVQVVKSLRKVIKLINMDSVSMEKVVLTMILRLKFVIHVCLDQ